MSDQVELKLIVPIEAAGRRLDAWLADIREIGSRNRAQRLIDAGRILVGGRVRPKGFRLAGGERVTVDRGLPEPPVGQAPAEVEIVWEDETLMVVDKPAGLVVHPAPGHRAVTLVELLSARGATTWRPFVVHRLDKNTSGLMLVAKDDSIQRRLRELIRRRKVEREYLALVAGRIGARQGTIDAPLGRDPRRRIRVSTRTSKPRPARTHFEVERFLGGYTLVRARLETGRTHQIRAHFAAIRHPVCGDPEYGGGNLLGLERQFLHSTSLAFPHPATDERVECHSALPQDLGAALRRAESAAR